VPEARNLATGVPLLRLSFEPTFPYGGCVGEKACVRRSPGRQRTLRPLEGILARYAAQHVGQRHSTNFLPVSETARRRRQPWLMLIRVVSRGAGGATAPHPTQTFSGLVVGLGASEL
jgi:hypothetical protein